MRAAMITAPHTIDIATIDDPVPGPHDVVVEVAGCGICGTDLHILDGDYIPLPIVPGHEFAGTVVAVGDEVHDLRVGDAVAGDPGIPCGRCHHCRLGRQNFCERNTGIGITVPGAAAEFVSVPAANCVRLPGDIDIADAALIEPLSCVVHAFDVLPHRGADRYVIYGAGTMGLMMLEMAKRSGAASIDVVDINEQRLATARELGCAHAATSAAGIAPERGYQIVIDCTGAVPAIEDGITRVAKRGTFLHFGVATETATVRYNVNHVLLNEISILASQAVLHSYERAAQLFLDGIVRPEVLISDRYPLDDYSKAIDQFKAGAGRKIQVCPGTRTTKAER